MKNPRKTGRSARHGNASSPYLKYDKRPHRYSATYYAWRGTIVSRAKRDEEKAARMVRP
jgi:hypothetical protein